MENFSDDPAPENHLSISSDLGHYDREEEECADEDSAHSSISPSSSDSDTDYKQPFGLGKKRCATSIKGSEKPPKITKYKRADIASISNTTCSTENAAQQVNSSHLPTIENGTIAFYKAVDQLFLTAQGGEKVKDVTKIEFKRAYQQYPKRCIKPMKNAAGEAQWTAKGMKFGLHHHQFLGVADMLKLEAEMGGGMLSDVMGVGKTRMILSLLLANRLVKGPGIKQQKTLIVVPSSLVEQWYDEADDNFDEKKLGKVVRYGASHQMIRKDLEKAIAKHQVIITTYDAVQKSYPEFARPDSFETNDDEIAWEQSFEAKAGPLLTQKFHRVVLDEAQAIKNANSITSLACREIKAEKHWAVSGTPLQNGVDELFPYFSFLKIKGAETIRQFKKNFPVSKNKKSGESERDKMLQRIMIRRTHDTTLLHQRIVDLPPKQERTIEVALSDAERTCYDAIDSWAKKTASKILQREGRKKNTQATTTLILVIIQQLREMTSHFMLIAQLLISLPDLDLEGLISEAISDASRASNQEKVIQMVDLLRSLFKKYSKDSGGIGFLERYIEGPSQSMISSKTENSKAKKPKKLKTPCKFQIKKWIKQDGQMLYSAKLRAAVEQIENWRQVAPDEKIIVFAQYTEVIKMIGIACEAKGWGHKLYFGQMNARTRNDAIDAFKCDKSVVVLVISLQCGGIGLNLTHGSKVIIFDLWWNTAQEDQAAARVHRMGQNRPVEILRLAAVGTIDDRIRKMQIDKATKIKEVMGGDAKANKATKVEDLMKLLGVENPGKASCNDDSDADQDLPCCNSEDELLDDDEESGSDSDTDDSSDSNSEESDDDTDGEFDGDDEDVSGRGPEQI